MGKDGVQRYRLHNLPSSSSCPGLYELGIAAVPTDVGRKSRSRDSQNIIVVYLGQTNNVRARLQQYGRAGAHLESGKLVSSVNENECSGLFKEVFCRGYSIMFRWAAVSITSLVRLRFSYYMAYDIYFLVNTLREYGAFKGKMYNFEDHSSRQWFDISSYSLYQLFKYLYYSRFWILRFLIFIYCVWMKKAMGFCYLF